MKVPVGNDSVQLVKEIFKMIGIVTFKQNTTCILSILESFSHDTLISYVCACIYIYIYIYVSVCVCVCVCVWPPKSTERNREMPSLKTKLIENESLYFQVVWFRLMREIPGETWETQAKLANEYVHSSVNIPMN